MPINCPNQHKFRQNFHRLQLASSKHSINLAHKLAQKHGLKGSWDGASKLIKNYINRLELKHQRVSNANGCFRLLSPELSKDTTNSDK